MFQPRHSEFDRRLSAIVDHLQAIEQDLAVLGRKAGRNAAAGASTASDQIAEVIGPILAELTGRFRRGSRAAIDEASSRGSDAVRIGAKMGSDAIDRIAGQASQRPLITLAVALGIGVLIGMANRRS